MAVLVRPLRQEDHRLWDEFVLSHPQGSPFHLIAWKRCIEVTFRYQPFYRVAWDGDRVAGVLPLFLIRNPFLGKVFVSSPFAVYGGILSSTALGRQALRDEVRELGESHHVQYVELRNAYPEQCVGFSRISRYVTFTRAAESEPETLLGQIPKKVRNMVRKARRYSYSVRRQSEDIGAFEWLHCRTLRRLGTPSFPPGHFRRLLEQFGQMIDIREVVLDRRVVAASMNFLFRDQMHTYYAASDPRYLSFAPNNYMYFDHILWAGRNGYRIFDFGRSKRNTGTFDFKRHWGAAMRELPYEVLLVERSELPNFSPENPKFQRAINVWKRLPLPVTKHLGPHLIRLFP